MSSENDDDAVAAFLRILYTEGGAAGTPETKLPQQQLGPQKPSHPPSHVFSEETFDITFVLEQHQTPATTDGGNSNLFSALDDVQIEATLEEYPPSSLPRKGPAATSASTANLILLEKPQWLQDDDDGNNSKDGSDDSDKSSSAESKQGAEDANAHNQARRGRIRCCICQNEHKQGEEAAPVHILHVPRAMPAVYRIRISAKLAARRRGRASKANIRIKSAATLPIRLVQYKLEVIPDPEHWTSTFFKDQGGRDKGLVVRVELHDCKGIVKTRTKGKGKGKAALIPLRVTLVYHNPHPHKKPKAGSNNVDSETGSVVVRDQSILRILHKQTDDNYQAIIDGATGRGKVWFRIDEISKNHQGKEFQLQIVALEQGGNDVSRHDVAPGYTPAVSVRSKPSKRVVRNIRYDSIAATTEAASDPSTIALSPSIGAGNSNSNNIHQSSLVSPPNAASFTDMGGGLTMENPGANTMTPPRQSHTLISSVSGESSFPSLLSNSSVSTTYDSVAAAFQGILQWIEEVVHGIHQMQWQLLGYAQNPDGSTNYQQPYHAIPSNPNSTIARILKSYSESARNHLQVLLRHHQNLRQNNAMASTAAPTNTHPINSSNSHTTVSAATTPDFNRINERKRSQDGLVVGGGGGVASESSSMSLLSTMPLATSVGHGTSTTRSLVTAAPTIMNASPETFPHLQQQHQGSIRLGNQQQQHIGVEATANSHLAGPGGLLDYSGMHTGTAANDNSLSLLQPSQQTLNISPLAERTFQNQQLVPPPVTLAHPQQLHLHVSSTNQSHQRQHLSSSNQSQQLTNSPLSSSQNTNAFGNLDYGGM